MVALGRELSPPDGQKAGGPTENTNRSPSWVPEGNLAGFFGVHFGGLAGPGKAFRNVGGEAPRIFEGSGDEVWKWELQDLSLSPVSVLGPEIHDFGFLYGPLLSQNTMEKVGGEAPPPFPVDFLR